MKPRHIALNAVQRAIEGSRCLPLAARRQVQDGIGRALLNFQRGQEPEFHWRALVDCHAVAEQLAIMGICSDDASCGKLAAMEDVLSAVWRRGQERGSWTLRANELAQLRDGIEIAAIQLDYCSRREYDEALRRVIERMQQALAGNAGPGVTVFGT